MKVAFCGGAKADVGLLDAAAGDEALEEKLNVGVPLDVPNPAKPRFAGGV